MEPLSLRQISLQYGFNAHTVKELLDKGILTLIPNCTPLRPKVDPTSLANLQEGTHYVVCASCGAFQALIQKKHLRACSGYGVSEYLQRHPKAQMLSKLCQSNKAKTETQRKAQSKKLLDRFQTEAGCQTKQQISEASKRMHASGYQEQAAEHLRSMTGSPEGRAQHRKEALARWQNGTLRKTVVGWHKQNPEESKALAANARQHNTKKYTKLHQKLKGALVTAGVQSVTEYEIGYYAIDEAIPSAKIAIEADGCYWHGCSVCGFPALSDNARIDKAKESFLLARGWRVMRFQGHRILKEADTCAAEVVLALAQGEPLHAPF